MNHTSIKLASGKYIDLANPSSLHVELQPIAKALSRACRFSGQCPKFYSVAEHCVHAADLALLDGAFPDQVKAILMHDAAEAFLGDVVKPLKDQLPKYKALELKMQLAISKRFGIAFGVNAGIIKRYDNAMLKAEMTEFWTEDKWLKERLAEFETMFPLIQCWSPEEAELQFLEAAWELGVK